MVFFHLTMADDSVAVGVLVGILLTGGHFGGDGRQAQITLKMHGDHSALFAWIERHFPGGRLYGPYHHGGRHYYQWMARGTYLQDVLVPILDEHLTTDLDASAMRRYLTMKERYRIQRRPEPLSGEITT